MSLLKELNYKLVIAGLISVIFLGFFVGWGEILIGKTWNSILINLSSALLASILVGIFFEINARKNLQKEIANLLDINDSVRSAGIIEYHSSWDSVDLTSFFRTSKSIDIYVSYAYTLFNDYEGIIEDFLKTRGKKLRIFVSDESNQFLKASADLWHLGDNKNSFDSIKEKLTKTIELLVSLKTRLDEKKHLKAQFSLYRVLHHPVNFSFYKSDDKIILPFNKLSQHKLPKPPVLVLKSNGDKTSLYKKISDDFLAIQEGKNKYLVQVF